MIQTGTLAAVCVGFGRYAGVLFPFISEDRYIVAPIHVSARYAVSLSVTQVVAVASTWPGFAIVLLGVPVYSVLRRRGRSAGAAGDLT